MQDPSTGKFLENVTCQKCRHRHPAEWSCAKSAQVAGAAKAERQSEPEIEAESLRDRIDEVLQRAGPIESRAWLLNELMSVIDEFN